MNLISEKVWLPTFLSEFHKTQLKPAGFKKIRHTFSRDMGLYWERFNFQGSDSNGINGWRFYLNVGVEFKEIPPEKYWSGFPNTHWSTRSEFLVQNSPKEWMYGIYTDKENLSKKLSEVIHVASKVMANNLNKIRREYLNKKIINQN